MIGLQWMLARGPQHAVIDELDQPKEQSHGRHENDRRTLPVKRGWPRDVSAEDRRCDERIRAQQDTEGAQHGRHRLHRQTQPPAATGGRESHDSGEQPGRCEQHVAPDDADEDERRWCQRQNGYERRKPDRSARYRESQ